MHNIEGQAKFITVTIQKHSVLKTQISRIFVYAKPHVGSTFVVQLTNSLFFTLDSIYSHILYPTKTNAGPKSFPDNDLYKIDHYLYQIRFYITIHFTESKLLLQYLYNICMCILF